MLNLAPSSTTWMNGKLLSKKCDPCASWWTIGHTLGQHTLSCIFSSFFFLILRRNRKKHSGSVKLAKLLLERKISLLANVSFYLFSSEIGKNDFLTLLAREDFDLKDGQFNFFVQR